MFTFPFLGDRYLEIVAIARINLNELLKPSNP
jgi:hypothetical protein